MAEASTSNPDQFVIPDELLTLSNYKSWKNVMRDNLEWHYLWSYLLTRHVHGIELRKDKEALEAIKVSCSEEMFPHIMYVEDAKEAWDLLEQTASWTQLEKENYNSTLAIAARAKANSQDVPEGDKILTRRNYSKWKVYMRNVLLSKHLWTVVDGSDKSESRSYTTKNHHALVIIRMSCGKEMFLYIDDENHAHDAWCKLEGELGAATPSNERRQEAATLELDSNELLRVIAIDNKPDTLSSNYDTWSVHMKTYLINQGLWGFLEETETLDDQGLWGFLEEHEILDDQGLRGFQEEPQILDQVKDEKALDAIKASCSPEVQAYILYINSAKHAWEELQKVTSDLAGTTDNPSKYDVTIYHHQCDKVEGAAQARAKLSEFSETDKVLTRRNYQMWGEYVTMLLWSRLLSDVVSPMELPRFFSHRYNDVKVKEACALRIIKEACGREMMPYIFRSKSPKEALKSLSKACSMDPKDDYMKYSRLLHAVQKNGFREQIRDLNGELWVGAHNHSLCISAEITEDGSTALHVAVRLGRVDFVKELLKLMTAPQSETKTHQGNTAIAVAVGGNNMEIVEMLVESNPRLLLIGNELELHAVTIAAINGNEKIMRYLYPSTKKHTYWWGARSVASLLTSASRLNAFDIVWDLLDHFPFDYVLERDDYGTTLLSVLAEMPSAFPSGNQFGLLGGWISRLAGYKRHGTVLKALQIIVPGAKKVLGSKKKHEQIAIIVRRICSLLLNLNPLQLKELSIYDAIHQSITHGIIELFENLINTNPYLEHHKDENERGLFQIAIMARQESIFQYMSEMGQRNQSIALLDKFGNNALHCAAIWDSSSQLVHSPALQMQSEIQWFQEVERVVPPRYKAMKNNEKLTPKTLFSREHRDLAKEAEKWMKEMSQTCIIATALIATIMFAAPFTLPGGSDQNTGVSLSLKTRAFRVFVISDVISLFASCTSLMIFFSILTARYAEPDFLTSLPRRLILGLFSLFIAIATMMATFTATVVIVLREDTRSRAYIWVSILACIPVVIFASSQLPLFVNLISSTYGHSIFRRKKVVVAPLISIGYG
ncbi:hypothetical protein MKX03_015379 [Papaver bracteatum]|nr:hypothetical protein MKX03_015379 [Papaver bracteatum]